MELGDIIGSEISEDYLSGVLEFNFDESQMNKFISLVN